jgi:hypothetical protein
MNPPPGGQVHWAKMIGMDRTQLNKMLHGPQLLNERVIKALKLRVVYAPVSEVEAAASVSPSIKLRRAKSVRSRR